LTVNQLRYVPVVPVRYRYYLLFYWVSNTGTGNTQG